MLFKEVYNCPCIACVFEKSFLPIQNIREFGLRNGYPSLENQKSQENTRRRPTKCRKRWKMSVVGRRNAKNAEKCSSSADETQKTLKNVCRRPTKREKRWKMSVVGRRNAKNAEKRPPSVDETQGLPKIIHHPWMKMKKRQKNARHPWMKVRKRWKSTFRHGGRVENSKNCISATADG